MSKELKIFVILITVAILIFGSLFALWYKGGSELSSFFIDINTMEPSPAGPILLYRGLKVPFTEGVFVLFRRYYAIVYYDHYGGLVHTIAYKQDGYNQYYSFYMHNGQIASHGYCMVETQYNGQLLHLVEDVKDAMYYDPEGNVVSTVKDGTGVQVFFYPDGTKQWELELESYRKRTLRKWRKDGELVIDDVYEQPVNDPGVGCVLEMKRRICNV
ncbi:MAG: hypothetical protein GXY41_04095 [Phycisphaerae bacterium]|nr:hypothetical protein [Phycisphaerae bacterium]